jgi:hypothetical protein
MATTNECMPSENMRTEESFLFDGQDDAMELITVPRCRASCVVASFKVPGVSSKTTPWPSSFAGRLPKTAGGKVCTASWQLELRWARNLIHDIFSNFI